MYYTYRGRGMSGAYLIVYIPYIVLVLILVVLEQFDMKNLIFESVPKIIFLFPLLIGGIRGVYVDIKDFKENKEHLSEYLSDILWENHFGYIPTIVWDASYIFLAIWLGSFMEAPFEPFR